MGWAGLAILVGGCQAGVMASEFLPVDRNQPFLMPPDMRDWLPEDHLAWFVLDVVARVDTTVLRGRYRLGGAGRRAYDPDMLLAVLIYAYCTGVRSSRQIERLCVVDVAFRVLAAGHVPDHTTIARFRRGHEHAAAGLFVDVLMLCAEAGLARVGVVAVDGTKIGANAALRANRSRAQLEKEVAAMLAEADEVDANEDALFGEERGDEMPEDLRDRTSRRARLDAALEVLNKQRRAREAEQAEGVKAERETWEQRCRDAGEQGRQPGGRAPASLDVEIAEQRLAQEEQRAERRRRERQERESEARARGKKLRGPEPHPENRDLRRARDRVTSAKARAEKRAASEEAKNAAKDRANVTDPDSRVMKAPKGWLQGYNAQAAVAEDGTVVAADVTQDHNDLAQCQPMMALMLSTLAAAGISEEIGTVLFDAGYLTEDNLTSAGPDRLIATGKSHTLKRSDPAEGPPPDGVGPIAAMEHRLRTPEGAELYAKRQHTVEPVFGDIKENRAFRRFTRRGLDAAKAEWNLIAVAHNIRKLHTAGQPAPT